MSIRSFKSTKVRSFLSISILASVLLSSLSVAAQGPDLVPVSDITGGSSVFVFRNASRSARKFSTNARSTRTRTQRLETTKKIKKQYDTLAISKPNRVRLTPVTPDNLPPAVKTMAPDKASTLFAGVGEYYIDRRDNENAINVFREAVVMNGKNIKAKEGLSDVLAVKGTELLLKEQPATAKAYFLESLKNNPKNAASYFGLGEVFTDLGQDSEAILNYEKALENDRGLTEIYVPLGILYFQAGEIAKADSLLSKAMASSSDTSEVQLFLGMIRMSQNRNPEALAAFQRANSLDPSSAEAAYNAGEALTRLNRSGEAITAYQKAVALKPTYFEAWLSLADAQAGQKNFAEAVVSYKQATKLKNDSADAFAGLADAQRMAGSYNDAIANYNLAILFTTRQAGYSKDVAADYYSKVGYSIGQQCAINMKKAVVCQWPQAITALEKAVELGSGNTADFANLGWAYYNAARNDGYQKRDADRIAKLELAKTNLSKAVAGNPPYIEGPLLNLGMTLTDLGDFAGAASALTKVVEKQSKWAFAHNELGIAYRKQNKFKEAIDNFSKAIEKDDSLVAAHFNLGEAEFRNGNISAAKKAYQKLKKMGQNNMAGQLELISKGAVLK